MFYFLLLCHDMRYEDKFDLIDLILSVSFILRGTLSQGVQRLFRGFKGGQNYKWYFQLRGNKQTSQKPLIYPITLNSDPCTYKRNSPFL